jgi:hypothetical protein
MPEQATADGGLCCGMVADVIPSARWELDRQVPRVGITREGMDRMWACLSLLVDAEARVV